MKNELLYRVNFTKERKPYISVKESSIEISGIRIETSHDTYCCEEVYADFSTAEYHIEEINQLLCVKSVEVKKVKDMGFIIFVDGEISIEKYNFFIDGELCKKIDRRIGILVNCYNIQNGCYVDELKIQIYKDNKLVLELDDLEKWYSSKFIE
jgi:hypothetical protein